MEAGCNGEQSASEIIAGGTMYYLIDNDPEQKYYDVSDVLNACITTDYWMDDTDGFDEFLDDGNGVEICGYDFNPSEILREMNFDAYCSELRSWAETRADSEREEGEYDLERARNGQCVYICGYDVYCYEEDDEDEEYGDTDGDDKLVFEQLEKKLLKEKEAEALEAEKDNAIGDDFLSIIGLQVI